MLRVGKAGLAVCQSPALEQVIRVIQLIPQTPADDIPMHTHGALRKVSYAKHAKCFTSQHMITTLAYILAGMVLCVIIYPACPRTVAICEQAKDQPCVAQLKLILAKSRFRTPDRFLAASTACEVVEVAR